MHEYLEEPARYAPAGVVYLEEEYESTEIGTIGVFSVHRVIGEYEPISGVYVIDSSVATDSIEELTWTAYKDDDAVELNNNGIHRFDDVDEALDFVTEKSGAQWMAVKP